MKLSTEWIDWIKTNIDLGCLPKDLINKMIEHGFDFDLACSAVTLIHQNKNISDTAVNILEQLNQPKCLNNLKESITQNKLNHITIDQHTINVAMTLNDPKLTLFNHVLTEQECDEIIALSEQKMQRSKVVDPQTGDYVVNPHRTSEGTFFNLCENELFKIIDHRLAQLMQAPLTHSEGCQILKYELGGEYRPHYDYFDTQNKITAERIAQSGQRISTLIIYLNDVEEGGTTYFPELNIHVMPNKGSAVYFEYYNPYTKTLDSRSLHAGMPVFKGTKWIMTKWVRDKVYL